MLRRCIRLLSCKGMLRHTCAAKIHTNYARVLYCSYNKDQPVSQLQTPLINVPTCDSNFLMEEIQECKTLDSILELFSNNQDVVNTHHIVAMLKSLHFHLNDRNLSHETLTENETFQAICTHLLKGVRTLETQEVINVYRVLSSLGIRNNSYIMRSVLRRIGKLQNSMDLEQVALLYAIISKQKHNALVDDLRTSLPLILQVKINRLMDSDDVSRAVDCLHLACHSRLKPDTVQKIVSSIVTKSNSLSPSNAASVISALVNITTPLDSYKQLLDASFEVVTEDIASLDQSQLLSLLKLCQVKGLHRSAFFSEAAKKVVSERWCSKSTQEVLKVFDAMKFRSPELKDHFASVSCLDIEAKTAKAV